MTAPTKVTREHLGMRIAAADYVVMPDGRTTVCQLTMQNGFTVRGESSCVSAENFKGLAMQPCIGLRTAAATMQPGWVPSQQDMMADDWVIVK